MEKKITRLSKGHSSLSANIVTMLQKEGMTLDEIGKKMGGLSHAFISMVKKGKRSFTVKRLQMLEVSLRKPLPEILLNAVQEYSVPHDLKSQYKRLRKILEESTKIEKSSSNSQFPYLFRSKTIVS